MRTGEIKWLKFLFTKFGYIGVFIMKRYVYNQ